MIKLSINQTEMTDTHKDASTGLHAGKSELIIDSLAVLDLLESLGFKALSYAEQAYQRNDRTRENKGYHIVNFTSKDHKDLGICLIDSKDGQSSLKLYAGLFIADRVFPLVLIKELRHSKYEKTKLDALPDTLKQEINQAFSVVSFIKATLKEINLSANSFNRLSDECFSLRLSHPNYKKTNLKNLVVLGQSVSGYNALKLVISSYCDVNWPRHLVTLSTQISDYLITKLTK